MENMDKTVKFGYFKINTTQGTGVVCIALARPTKDATDRTYRGAFAFCSPKDKKSFNKKRARTIAYNRLVGNSTTYVQFTVTDPLKDNLYDVFTEALVRSASTIKVETDENQLTVAPNWLVKSVRNNTFQFGLSEVPRPHVVKPPNMAEPVLV